MERMVIEGFMFHRLCFKCNICGNLLKSTTYELSEDKKFYCEKHSSDVGRVINFLFEAFQFLNTLL